MNLVLARLPARHNEYSIFQRPHMQWRKDSYILIRFWEEAIYALNKKLLDFRCLRPRQKPYKMTSYYSGLQCLSNPKEQYDSYPRISESQLNNESDA